MVSLFVLGLLWLVVYYIGRNSVPLIDELNNWNLAVGFALIGLGFMVATRWK